jgi:ribosome-binding protein aMBF1 (putative translation factor)
MDSMTTNSKRFSLKSTTQKGRPTVVANGKKYVLIEPKELRRLEQLAASAESTKVVEGGKETRPQLPPADANGNRPAVAFARASVAQSIFDERSAVGLSQQELARLSGVRQETISRIESGKHSPTIRTIEKIDRILQAALKKAARRAKRK